MHRAAITIIHSLRPEIVAANDFMVLAELFSTLKSNPKFFNSSVFIKQMFALTSNLSKQTIQRLRVKNAPIIEQENKETQIRIKEREAWLARHKQMEREHANNAPLRQSLSMRPPSRPPGQPPTRAASYVASL